MLFWLGVSVGAAAVIILTEIWEARKARRVPDHVPDHWADRRQE